jgi:hypothetical protein
MAHEFTTCYVKDSISLFRFYKRLAERSLAQIPDAALTAILDAESNSIAQIVKHMAGNMRSRWTDFLTTDGEKADRNRDGEFESPPQTRAETVAMWDAGWKTLFDALESLTEADETRTVMIRNEPHSVMQAINRQLAHYSYHMGQIIYLAKHFAEKDWQAVTVPRGKSVDFTAQVVAGKLSQR